METWGYLKSANVQGFYKIGLNYILTCCEISGFCSVCILFEESVFDFQFLNDRIYYYVLFNIIVNSVIQKLQDEHIFFKKYTNWVNLSSLVERIQLCSICIIFKESVLFFNFWMIEFTTMFCKFHHSKIEKKTLWGWSWPSKFWLFNRLSHLSLVARIHYGSKVIR